MSLTDLPNAITMDRVLTRMTAFLHDVGGYTGRSITTNFFFSAVQSCMTLHLDVFDQELMA